MICHAKKSRTVRTGWLISYRNFPRHRAGPEFGTKFWDVRLKTEPCGKNKISGLCTWQAIWGKNRWSQNIIAKYPNHDEEMNWNVNSIYRSIWQNNLWNMKKPQRLDKKCDVTWNRLTQKVSKSTGKQRGNSKLKITRKPWIWIFLVLQFFFPIWTRRGVRPVIRVTDRIGLKIFSCSRPAAVQCRGVML